MTNLTGDVLKRTWVSCLRPLPRLGLGPHQLSLRRLEDVAQMSAGVIAGGLCFLHLPHDFVMMLELTS